MAVNLIDMVKSIFPSDASSSAANLLGENETNVRNALDGVIPSILAGVLNKSQSGGGGLGSLLNNAKDLLGSGTLGHVFSGGAAATDNSGLISKGIALLQSLFGDKLGSLVSSIAGFAGIKESSANTLLGAAAPAALGAVGQHAASNNLDEGGILNFLNAQKENILSALPAGLSLGSLGLGSLADRFQNAGSSVTDTASHVRSTATEYIEDKKGGGGWLMWLLLLVLAALAIWYFMGKGCNKSDETLPPTTDTMITETTTETVTTNTARESMKVILPDGVELDAYKGGIEDQLVSFLKTDYMALGEDSLKNTWFNFDNLNFETGSATLTAESQAQVANMVAILKAFPKAKLKIGGYTDKVGNEANNVKLSTDRAKAVATALKDAGVGAQVTDAEGYGSQFAKYPSDAAEADRVTDRKVSVSVR